jgi:hypothetical protein
MIKLTTTPGSKSYTDHSTPIQNRCKMDCDSPDLTYNESPIEPLTQHPPNEVGWNYQRIILKEDDVKTPISMEISRTPKRSVLLHKKRNSNSPLLYKPLKKKLIQEEQQEHMAGFMAELKAIELKAKKIGEKNSEVPSKFTNELESQLIIELDSQPIDYSDIKLQVSAIIDESPPKENINLKKSYKALLDDSIEDIMVLCSQEVEAKEFGIKRKHCTTSNNTSQEKNCLRTSPDSNLEKMCENLSQENQQSLNNNEQFIGDIISPPNKKDSGSLEIPDDSFDEFFVGIDDKDIAKNGNNNFSINNLYKSVVQNNKFNTKCKSATSTIASKINTIQNKFFQSKNSSYITLSKGISATSCNYVNNSQSSNALVQNKVINTKASFGYLNKNYVRNNNSSGYESQTQNSDSSNSIKSNNTRLFKAKSYSDSNFLHQNTSNNNIGNSYMSNSNFNTHLIKQQKEQSKNSVNQNVKSNYYVTDCTLQNKSWRRIQSSPSIDKSNIKQQSNVNRLSNNEGSQLLSTAAEIERKRQEAIMKREAKLKMKFDHMSLKRPIQNPIKR